LKVSVQWRHKIYEEVSFYALYWSTLDGEKWSALNLGKDLEPGWAPKFGHAQENNLYIHARNETQSTNLQPTLYPLRNENYFQHKLIYEYLQQPVKCLQVSTSYNFTNPLIEFNNLFLLSTSREITSMYEYISFWYIKSNMRRHWVCVTHTHNSNLEQWIIKNRYLYVWPRDGQCLKRNDSNQNTSQSIVNLRACVKDKPIISAQRPQS